MTVYPWKIEVRDAALQRVGQLRDYQQLEMTLKFNDVSTWQLTVDRHSPLASALTQKGAGIVVSRDGTAVLSGPWQSERHEGAADSDTLVLRGVDDTVWLKRREGHPQPTSTAPPYSTNAEDVRTGGASSVMRQFVGANLAIDGGTPAIPPRQYPGLSRLADIAYGATVTGRARWQDLLTLLQELAVQGAVNGIPVGFRIVQVGAILQYQGYLPVDRTATAVFSKGFHNLEAYTFERTAPEANYFYVGGDGEGTARTIYEHSDPASIAQWGRIEGFVDARSAANAAELAQAGVKAAADQGEKTSLSITPIDTERLAFGVHYGLGDRVTAVIDPVGPVVNGQAGEAIQDLVRECKITLAADKTKIEPSIGSQDASVTPVRLFRHVKAFSNRLRNIERQ